MSRPSPSPRLAAGRCLLDADALAIVEACLDHADPQARARLIAERCAGDAALAARVRAILAMEERADALLPTGGLGPGLGLDDPVPAHIGKFRVTDVIARGGMGTVVRAERDDGLYAQTVAIKLIRADLADPRLAERFAEERRLLARLSYPAIARILDGGEEGGRPWLAMEYVDGEPVTEWLAARGAGLAETLDAFAAIAAAVSHAHRNLAVHGDIKPGNVFATGDGAIKLLDFGVGRLLDRIDASGSAWPLTRAYAPPERIAGEPPSISGDVYGLGVLLHEMLTGRLPEPGTPMHALTGERVPAAAMRGDLDAIVAQATHPDPVVRYPDVAALAADLERHRGHRPVEVRPHRFGYVAERWLRRNRRALSVAAGLALVLGVAGAVSLHWFLDARAQRIAAAARAEQVRSLAKYQLFSLYDQLASVPGSLAARSRLAAEAQRYLDQLAARPDATPPVRLETAAGYDRLAAIQGVPNRPNIGDPAHVLPNLDRARAMLDRLAAETPGRAVTVERARNQLYRADYAVWQDGDLKAAAAPLAAADALVATVRDGSAEWRDLESYRRQIWQDYFGWSERYAEERAFSDATLRWWARFLPAVRDAPDAVIARARALGARSEALFYLGDRDAALADSREADALVGAALATHPDDVHLLAARLSSGYNLVTTLDAMGRRDGLLPMTAELVATARQVRAYEPADRQLMRRARNVDGLYTQLLADAGRTREAVAAQTALVAEDRRLAAAAPGDVKLARDLGFSRRVLGTLLLGAGDKPRACAVWRASEAGLAALARRGKLNDWDRTNVLASVRSDLRKCG